MRRAPEAVAVEDGTATLTYGALWAQAQAVAADLAAHGIGAGAIVAIRVPRGLQQIVAICGVLASGAAYVPVDPDYPQPAQQHIHADSAAVAMLDPGADGPVVRELHPADPQVPPAGTAYLLYTSGSTGAPKGVLVGHRHVLAMLRACRERFDVGPADRWTLFHSSSFDFSVWELWGCLLGGGRLVIVDQATRIDPAAFARLLREREVTVLSLVPSVFGVLVDELAGSAPAGLPRLRYVVFGGEPVNPSAIERWRAAAVAPACRLVNMYGITEITVHATFATLGSDLGRADGSTPIGQALPHLSITVADDALRPVAPGEIGELLVAGESVAFGYWRRPELTAERFVEIDSVRHYRSGDRAYADSAGQLHYLGRLDGQVKVRGHRIELVEVEAALLTHPAVTVAACAVKPGPAGHDILVAYVTAEASLHELGQRGASRALREHLQARLPAHEVPTRFHLHDALPLTSSGKVDRRALAN